MTAIRSASWSASSSCWVVSSTVTPSFTSARMAAQTSLRPRGSRPVVGSSRNSTAGERIRPAARSSRRRIPPEYCATGLPPVSARPKRSSSSSARARARRGAEVVQPPEQHEVLAPAEHLVDRGVLPDEPDPPPRARRIARDVDARDHRPPAVRAQQRREDPDRRRLARAVGPEQPEHAAGLHATGRSRPAPRPCRTACAAPPQEYLRTPYGVIPYRIRSSSDRVRRKLRTQPRAAVARADAAHPGPQAQARSRPDRRGRDRGRRRGGPRAAVDAQGRRAPGRRDDVALHVRAGQVRAAGPDGRRERRPVNHASMAPGASGSSRSRASSGSATTGTRGCWRSRWSARCSART